MWLYTCSVFSCSSWGLVPWLPWNIGCRFSNFETFVYLSIYEISSPTIYGVQNTSPQENPGIYDVQSLPQKRPEPIVARCTGMRSVWCNSVILIYVIYVILWNLLHYMHWIRNKYLISYFILVIVIL